MRKKLLLIISCLLLVLAGCAGVKEIQNQTYITTLGLDYSKGEFILYTQALNFSNIAKQEGGSGLQQSAPILIGQSKGKSIQSALSKLEQNAALPLYYGHVNTILLSKTVLEKELPSVIDFIGHNPSLRYNCWLYGTDADIKEILRGEGFFNYPSLYTLLHRPEPLIRENFFIPIGKYNRFISRYYQAVGSSIIPSIEIKEGKFLKNKRPLNIVTLTGGYAISQQKYKGWVSKQDLVGLKWFSKHATNIPLSLFKERASVIIKNPKGSITVLNGKNPSYQLNVKTHALIVYNADNISVKKIEKELSQQIKNQIVKTLNKSDELKVDLLNISEKPYRYQNKTWDKNTINHFKKELVKDINVKIIIDETINYKR
ncbi:Ger(x)C family spore germination protein [Neobacillus sp. MM2021_6]|uniref:Ger(x)C family spore germination protein n=1 Tax=Bacillaceae TaxID=186817 RepID=UPI0014076419|nr:MULTISPECIES: Ger(x)C family spore germination protein [Bacillaceae]MBO0959659.1 Ger(x)C family spore germination protein [Neobacillus sp. MM2021_6]NHC19768.1 Ger(x)C family spore germination protein [Bacillus sp. MM2020_4]